MSRRSRKRNAVNVMTILLVLTGGLGLSSTAMIVGVLPGFQGGEEILRSATATHQGYLSINFQGLYHYVKAYPNCTSSPNCPSSENVFFLDAKNGTVRLILYCGDHFCQSPSQLTFGDGACVHVKGTLIEPSEWPKDQFSPSMTFTGDLYVFATQVLPVTSCS